MYLRRNCKSCGSTGIHCRQTTSAHSFDFIFPNVGVGTYSVEIQMAVNFDAQVVSGSGSAVRAAAFGLGSVTVELVRLVHDFSF